MYRALRIRGEFSFRVRTLVKAMGFFRKPEMHLITRPYAKIYNFTDGVTEIVSGDENR